ncbi:MAG: ABC transporter ATP-binding protein, partial [Candidatus Dormibacteria bacterium]
VPYYATSGEKGALLNSRLVNNLDAIATVKSFSAEEYEIDRIRHLSEAYLQSNRPIDMRSVAYAQTVRVCAVASFVGFILLGGLEVLAGVLSFHVFQSLVSLPFQLLARLPGLGGAVDQYQQTVASLGRVLDLRGLPVESGESGEPLDVAKVRGEMVFDGVTFAYPGRSPVLNNLSLRIAARKTTGVVGVTGAGKTTIAKLLMRFQDVASGRVLLDGVDIRDVRRQDLRHAIGFVAQDAFLFDGTVGDNIRYGSFDADPEQVVNAARLAEADSFVETLPSQYNTIIGERGVTLSGGQKQRLSLARAILKGAPILILDEATSAVDNETEAAIQRALTDFARDRTLVIIAHRLSTIRHADWIYVMGKGGVIAEEGTHNGLLKRGGVYASLWRLQIGEVSS